MRILFIGDIFGSPGRAVARQYLEAHGEDYDLIIANGENATAGRGLNRRHFQEIVAMGVDVVTLGNHTWDQAETAALLEESPRLVRAANYPPGTPGLGHTIVDARDGGRVAVAQLMGRVFMDPLDDPFRAADDVLQQIPADVPLLFDVHAEATSEKRVLGWHVRGRAAAVIGTHTHVQTADENVRDGTAYITDAGMTGVQDAAIGMAYEEVHYRFTTRMPRRYRPAEGRAALNGVVVEIAGARAVAITRLEWWPEP